MEDRLYKFGRLVEAGSFTKAARELHISQPALSIAIAKLEREVQNPLLKRGAYVLELTEAGRFVYQTAKDIQTSTTNLKVRLAELANQEIKVSIGMIDSVASNLFATDKVINKLERQAHVSVNVNNSRYLLKAITHDELDIAFVVAQPGILPSGIEVLAMGTEPLVIVCHAKKQQAMLTALKNGQLPSFISYDESSNSHQLIHNALEQRAITPLNSFYSTSPDVMLRLVLLQKGAAALPYLLVKEHLRQGTLVMLRDEDHFIINRPIDRIKRYGKEVPLPLEQMTRQVRHLLRQLNEEVHELATRM